MSGSRRYGACVLLALMMALASAVASAQDAPRRVVSINVCTDQLAMLIAGEGQLHSVSRLAIDPDTSVMADEAAAYEINHGLAEEVFLMRPDLVLAGTFTARATVELLRRLGFRVEQFAPTNSFDDIRENIERIGALLDRRERAAELLVRFEAELDAIARIEPSGLLAASYSSNSYTTGAGTLTDAVMRAAGLRNLAGEEGIVGGARMPLEMLMAADPDIVVTGTTRYERPALAQENFVHPAFRSLSASAIAVTVPDRYWICGAPFTLEAVRILQGAAMKQKADAAR